MKTLLVPTDFSACADLAAKQAIMLAEKLKASVYFLHAVSTPVDWASYASSVPSKHVLSPKEIEKNFPETKARIASAQNKLTALVKQAEKKGINAYAETGYNLAHKDIMAFAVRKKVDLIVMGSTGAGAVKGLLLGSNASKVIRLSEVPVLVLSPNTKPTLPKNMVYASDFEEEALNKNIHKLSDLCKKIGASPALLYINTPSFFESSQYSEKKLKNIQLKYGIKENTYYTYNDFTVEEGIHNFCKQHQADFVALSTHGRKGVSRLFYDNIAEILAGRLEKPLLIFPKK